MEHARTLDYSRKYSRSVEDRIADDVLLYLRQAVDARRGPTKNGYSDTLRTQM
jgi:hypothetical protein